MITATILAFALSGTPQPVEVEGPATWFDATRNGQSSTYTRAGIRYYIAAGPALRRAMGGSFYRQLRPVRICGDASGTCLIAYVADWCSCQGSSKRGDERVADLSPDLFRALGTPLARGVQRVTITPLVPAGPGVVDSSDSGRCAAQVWGINNATTRRCAHRHRPTRNRGLNRVS